MIYFSHLSIKWCLAYPTSALVFDVVTGVIFLGAIICLVWYAHLDKITKKDKEVRADDSG